MAQNGPTMQSAITVRFWGVRGSVACAGPQTLRYGGNTSCVEVRCGNRLFVFDAGTGMRPLGEKLAQAASPLDGDIFFSHCHLDHIIGLPFFGPAYTPGNHFRLWAGHLLPDRRLKEVLYQLMETPLFPVPPDIFKADIEYHDFHAGETLTPQADITIRTASLNHPDGATGYRIEHAGRSVAYITDTEHRPDGPDKNVLALADRVNLMIYDATYTDEEYGQHTGWGHSTWQEGIRLADAAGVGQLVIFHHDPGHDDTFMDRIAAAAAALRPGTVVAIEGSTIDV